MVFWELWGFGNIRGVDIFGLMLYNCRQRSLHPETFIKTQNSQQFTQTYFYKRFPQLVEIVENLRKGSKLS